MIIRIGVMNSQNYMLSLGYQEKTTGNCIGWYQYGINDDRIFRIVGVVLCFNMEQRVGLSIGNAHINGI